MSDRTFKTNKRQYMFTWHMELFASSCCGSQSRTINEEGKSLFLYVHFYLDDMRGVCNHGLPSKFQLLALTFHICLQLVVSLTGNGAASHQHGVERGKEMQHCIQKQFLKLFSYTNFNEKITLQ